MDLNSAVEQGIAGTEELCSEEPGGQAPDRPKRGPASASIVRQALHHMSIWILTWDSRLSNLVSVSEMLGGWDLAFPFGKGVDINVAGFTISSHSHKSEKMRPPPEW